MWRKRRLYHWPFVETALIKAIHGRGPGVDNCEYHGSFSGFEMSERVPFPVGGIQ